MRHEQNINEATVTLPASLANAVAGALIVSMAMIADQNTAISATLAASLTHDDPEATRRFREHCAAEFPATISYNMRELSKLRTLSESYRDALKAAATTSAATNAQTRRTDEFTRIMAQIEQLDLAANEADGAKFVAMRRQFIDAETVSPAPAMHSVRLLFATAQRARLLTREIEKVRAIMASAIVTAGSRAHLENRERDLIADFEAIDVNPPADTSARGPDDARAPGVPVTA